MISSGENINKTSSIGHYNRFIIRQKCRNYATKMSLIYDIFVGKNLWKTWYHWAVEPLILIIIFRLASVRPPERNAWQSNTNPNHPVVPTRRFTLIGLNFIFGCWWVSFATLSYASLHSLTNVWRLNNDSSMDWINGRYTDHLSWIK